MPTLMQPDSSRNYYQLTKKELFYLQLERDLAQQLISLEVGDTVHLHQDLAVVFTGSLTTNPLLLQLARQIVTAFSGNLTVQVAKLAQERSIPCPVFALLENASFTNDDGSLIFSAVIMRVQ